MRKTRSEKSRDTVPLKRVEYYMDVNLPIVIRNGSAPASNDSSLGSNPDVSEKL